MKELKDIEKSLNKKYKKVILSRFLRAIKDFNLIEENDNIAICVSGGKDSFLLAKCMQELKRHNKFNFTITFIVMDPGYAKTNLEKIKSNAKLLNIPINIFTSDIFDVVKKVGKDSPCYLCARMRRGYLYSKAAELGCNKIALGHHFNDVIETILLNQLYNGNFSGMLPILDSENFSGMKLIRPLYYVHEDDIISWAKYNELEFLDCACNVTKKDIGKRKEVKELIQELVKTNQNADINIFNSMFNVNSKTTFKKM
jgi:tRNA 2-thiocytidine biosynthesis protein TtcA